MKKKKILTEVFVLFFIAAVFMAVYVVIEMGNDWLAVLGGAAVLLIASYLLIDYQIECENDNKEADADRDELGRRLDEQEEVQKAIYTVIKRGNSDNAELLQKIDSRLEELTQVLQRIGDASSAQNAELEHVRNEIRQSGQETLDVVKELRQDYQIGVKNLIKYEKENAKQIAENAHTNAEMTIMELSAQLAKLQECLEEQKDVLANVQLSPVNVPYAFPEEVSTAFEPDGESEELLPVLDDAKPVEIPVEAVGDEETSEAGTDEFDAEAAIRAYMIEQGYVDAEETVNPEVTELPIIEPMIEEPVDEPGEEPVDEPGGEPEGSAWKSEEEIASTLQSMASGDPNRALTPEEIAAMFAAIQ